MADIKAVLFDLDGTLINSRIDFRQMKDALIKYLEAAGVKLGLLSNAMLNYEIMEKSTKYLQQKGYSKDRIREILGQASKIMDQFELESLEEVSLIEGVSETLEALKNKRLKLGIMTRSCREYTEKVLSKFGLLKYFDAIVARDDIEKPKPNAEHALHLLSLLGVSAHEAICIGDHWSDAECAQRAGVKFIIIGRRGDDYSRHSDCKSIEKLEDVIKLLGHRN